MFGSSVSSLNPGEACKKMPPTNAVDQAYSDAIDRIIQDIGYHAAFRALERERLACTDATFRQVFHMDGAMMNDFVAIVARHKNWSIRFIPGTKEIEIKKPAGTAGKVGRTGRNRT